MRKSKFIISLIAILLIAVILNGCVDYSSSNIDNSEEYSVNVTIEGRGKVNKEPDKSNYSKDTEITLKAEPDKGWTFDHWEGDIENRNNPTNILVDNDYNVRAIFYFEDFLVDSTVPSNNAQDVSAEIEYIDIYFSNTLDIDGQQAAKAVTITPSPNFLPGWRVEDDFIRISLLSGILEFEQNYQIQIDNTKVWDVKGNTMGESYSFNFTVESDTYPPDTPSIGITTQENDVTLNWTTVYDNPSDGSRARKVDKYKIYRKVGDGNFINIDSVDETQTDYSDINLESGTYSYYVTAVDKYSNESDPSNKVNTTIE